MNENQKQGFWAAFMAFCVVATWTIAKQGAFVGLSVGGGLIIVFSYLIVTALIHKYVELNPRKFE